MNKLVHSTVLLLLAFPALALDTSAEITVNASVPYDAPQLIFDSPTHFTLNLDGRKKTIDMCIYDGSVDGSASQTTPPAMRIKFSDQQRVNDGPRSNPYVYSIARNGDLDADVSHRIDMGLDAVTPNWGQGSWGWSIKRGEPRNIPSDYTKYTIDHASVTPILTRFKCLPFNIELYPIGDPSKPQQAAIPYGKVPGNYSGTIKIELTTTP